MGSSPCLDPDAGPYEKMREAIRFSEDNRQLADDIVASHRPQVELDMRQRHRESGMHPPTDATITTATNIRAGQNPAFADAIANERWGWRLTTMYAAEQSLRDTAVTQGLLRDLVQEIRGLRAELARRGP